jgi:hypothetical protein
MTLGGAPASYHARGPPQDASSIKLAPENRPAKILMSRAVESNGINNRECDRPLLTDVL